MKVILTLSLTGHLESAMPELPDQVRAQDLACQYASLSSKNMAEVSGVRHPVLAKAVLST